MLTTNATMVTTQVRTHIYMQVSNWSVSYGKH